jgi:predicted O-methyltransferase YrrM
MANKVYEVGFSTMVVAPTNKYKLIEENNNNALHLMPELKKLREEFFQKWVKMKQTEKTKPVKVVRSKNIWQRPIARKYNKDWAVEVEVGDFLYGLVRILKPAIIIETGTFEGFSGVRMAQALKDNDRGMLFTIDQKNYGAKKMFDEYEVTNWVKPIIGKSPEALKKLISTKKADFIFLDNGHQYNILSAELDILDKHIKVGTYIAGHDYYSQTNTVGLAVNDFIKRNEGKYQNLPIDGGNGIFILRKL